MRGNKERTVVRQERKELENKSCEERKDQRRVKGKAEKLAEAVQRSPAGKKAAATRKTKRVIAQKKEQTNYQKIKARASAGMGGRRKQLRAEEQDKLEQ